MDRVLPPYPPDRSASAQRQLERLGVEVRTKTRVVDLRRGRCPRRPARRHRGDDPGADRLLGGRRPDRAFARTVAEATGAADRPRRTGHRRARPDDPGPSRDLRRRRRGRRAVEAGPSRRRASPRARCRAGRTRRRSSAGASSAGRTSRSGTATTATSPSSAAWRASPNIGWLGPFGRQGGFTGLGALARHPHLLPDRLLEPDRRPHPLGVDVPDPRPRHAADHRARSCCRRSSEPEPPVLAPLDPRSSGRRTRPRQMRRPEGDDARLAPIGGWSPSASARTSIRNVVPPGPVRSTAIRPPFAASSSRAIVRPRPSPVGGRSPGRWRGRGRRGRSVRRRGAGRPARCPGPWSIDADRDGIGRPSRRPRPSRRRRPGCGARALATTLRSARPGGRGSAHAATPPARPSTSTRTAARGGGHRAPGATRGTRPPRSTARRSSLERRRLGAWRGRRCRRRRSPRAAAADRAASRPAAVGRDDAVDHRLELRLEHGRGRGEVVGDVAGRPPPEHLGPFEAVGHRVERLGQLGRFAVVAAGRPGVGVAGLEPPGGVGHVAQRPGQPAGDEVETSTIRAR